MIEKKSETDWKRIIEAWKRSGLTRSEYCRQNQLVLSTFDYWKRKLNKSVKATGLVKIHQTPRRLPLNPYSIKVTTRGFAVEVGPGVPPPELRTVLTVCKELL